MRQCILYFIFAISLISCEDFLEVEPDQQISFEEQFSTQYGLEEIVSGIYYDLEALASSSIHYYPGILGGNISFAPRISNRALVVPSDIEQTYSFDNTPQSLDYEGFYDSGYDLINSLNLVLDRLDRLEYLNEAQRNQIRAELLAIRALSHYQLSLVFSQNINFTSNGSHLGIVYNITTIQAGSEFPARQTAAATYELMKADLEQAIDLFTGDAFLPIGPADSYFNETSTRAIYARIALQNNDWETAAAQSLQVIQNSGLGLTTNDDYVDQFTSDNDLDETILRFTAPLNSDGNVSSSVSQYYLYTSNTVYNSFIASGDLISLFEDDDIRLDLYESQRIPTSTPTGFEDRDYFFTTKYQSDNQTTFIRLSEMFLIRAEALERTALGSGEARELVNLIRERAGIDEIDDTDDLLEEIYQERRRELAFESFLHYDNMRYKRNIIRELDCLSNVCNLDYPSPFYILPIPQESVEGNENMIQNEGY